MLDRHDTSAGGLIMVFTDGEETERNSPNIEEITPVVLQNAAIVHGLLLKEAADGHNLIQLADDSGGEFCIYEDMGFGGVDYYMCLMNMIANIGIHAAFEVK